MFRVRSPVGDGQQVDQAEFGFAHALLAEPEAALVLDFNGHVGELVAEEVDRPFSRLFLNCGGYLEVIRSDPTPTAILYRKDGHP